MTTQMPQKVAEFLGYQASAWGDDDAGNTVVGSVAGGSRHLPKPGGGSTPGKGGAGAGDMGAKSGAKLGAKPAAAAAGGPDAGLDA
ncbi:hypothetical protein [Aureimonas sp. AU40]|uniref:hypothetical protein n=1 Tax=Aureimonas sp. AU40 TaxID=1637747 RepID=UPI000781F2AA|nr:hypothetical protein [Aureimonas sp. AU40]